MKWRHLRVTSGHLRSRDVTFCHVTASSCEQQPCRKMYSIRQFSTFYSHFQVTSDQMMLLPGHFRLPKVTWRHFLSHHSFLLRATALEEVKCTVYASFWPSTSTSRWLPVKWRHFRVTFGHLWSRDVISCHVTESSCELQPCRKWNVHYTLGFDLLQPLPGDFRSNEVTSGHLRSRDVTSCHVSACSCELQACNKWNIQYTPLFNLLQPPRGDFRSNYFTFGSLPVTWGHVTSLTVTWQPPPASYSLVRSEMHSILQFSTFYSHFQVTSGQMMSLPRHFRSPEVTWRHFLSCDCLLLWATGL